MIFAATDESGLGGGVRDSPRRALVAQRQELLSLARPRAPATHCDGLLVGKQHVVFGVIEHGLRSMNLRETKKPADNARWEVVKSFNHRFPRNLAGIPHVAGQRLQQNDCRSLVAAMASKPSHPPSTELCSASAERIGNGISYVSTDCKDMMSRGQFPS